MKDLETIYRECPASEVKFKNKALLFIGSESYDAPTITVLQGLSKLGFAIYTLKKPNINSWFCNIVVEAVDHLKFDFVLSNLHWGTRWSYYEQYKLCSYPKVLIDGDDNHGQESWREKYARYARTYVYDPLQTLRDMELHPYRWVEPLGNYGPDLVFTAQKMPGDRTTLYLPFGIHEQYKALYERKPTEERNIDFAHIHGPGVKRVELQRLLSSLARLRLVPGRVYAAETRGEEFVADEIRSQVANDNNVHSYHRWTLSREYFRVLNRTKVLIYPGVYHSQWDSKRPWEAYASGCLVMLANPEIDISEYPATQICDFAVFRSKFELVEKCWFLYLRPAFLDHVRRTAIERAWKYFSPEAVARYFLYKVRTNLH